MSQENVELVASIYSEPRDYVARFGPHATEAMRAELRPLYDPEYEFHAVLESDRMVHRDFDGYLDFMGDWLVPWKSYTIAADDVRDLEPDRVVVLTRHRGQLKGGGGEVRTLGVDLWTLREGRLLRLEAYMDRRAGLEAAGLRD
jgi:ketosteroid isomerase-like protein